jgi:octaprenyl-diphosphate synthase
MQLDVIRADLQRIEEELRAAASSEVHQVDAVGQHVLLAGGKRFRPACVVLSARAVNADAEFERLVAVATAMELVHTATLVHDDVVDNTWVRRGSATANAVFGNGVAVLTGDFLLARAVRMLAHEQNMRLMRTVADVTVEMSEGEVQQMVATGDAALAEEAYYELIRKKTATFIQGCCRCGAILAGARREEEDALAEYGLHIGLAFQLTDDLLDYTGDPAITGKPVGGDLREGRATLPLLLGLRATRDGKRDMLLASFGNSSLQDAAIPVVVRTLDLLGAFEGTAAAACGHALKAKGALSVLPQSCYLGALEQLADYVIQRDR